MSLFNFVKDAGSKLFGMESTQEANLTKTTQAKNLVTNELNLPIRFFNCTINDDQAVVTGVAQNIETQEKAILAIGNIKGIATVQNNMTVAPEANTNLETIENENQGLTMATSAEFYTVKSGDTLGKIAQTFLGSASKYPVIFEANKPLLTDPNKIYPGQTLRIPKNIITA